MTHYQKLATMIFRIVGAFFLVLGAVMALVSLAITFLFKFSSYGNLSSTSVFMGNFCCLPAIIFGILFFGLSRILAKWVCFDFYKFNE